MALYEFICEECKLKKEMFLPMSKRNEQQKCNCGKPMDRLISGSVGFDFVGEGFYENDYAKKKDMKKLFQKEKKWRKDNIE